MSFLIKICVFINIWDKESGEVRFFFKRGIEKNKNTGNKYTDMNYMIGGGRAHSDEKLRMFWVGLRLSMIKHGVKD